MDNSIRISSAAVSDRGLSEKRPQNEDSFLEMGQSRIFAVADGVGGAQAGEVASQMAVEILGEAFANFTDGSDAETVMRTAIERGNAAIYQMAQELPQLANMATTIVALYLDGNIATIGHVGDSRLYSVDRDGSLARETDDHSMVAEEVRAGRMTEEQAENHPSRNIISRALGAEPTVQADIKTIMIQPGTSFLLCSDGITRHVADQEIKGVLTFGGDPVDICEYLKGLCYERGAEDNLTAVVVKVSGTAATLPQSEPVFEMLDEDEPTIATTRSAFMKTQDDSFDEIDLLGLESQKIDLHGEQTEEAITKNYEASTEPAVPVHLAPEPNDESQIEESKPFIEPEPEAQVSTVSPQSESESFTMFGDSGGADTSEPKPGVAGQITSAIALLLVGAAVGMGVYYFALTPKAAEPSKPQLSEMKASNIPLSAFEENRRDVDKNPAAYLQKNPSPQDAEDYYLVGRAFLLTGDFPKAHNAFVESRNRLNDADPINAQILRNDLAVSIAVTNDTTIQTIVKKELTPPAANANTSANANR